MIDFAEQDICRYYGDNKPINDLGGGEPRNRAQAERNAPIVAAQWRLRRFAKGKPADIWNRVFVICGQLRESARAPQSKALRSIVTENIGRLKGEKIMARINYPESWSQTHRDALDAMFAESRAKGLWFFHNSLAVGPTWFSPDELEEQQKRGHFIWSAENWRLRDPQECLNQAGDAVTKAKAERDSIADRVHKARVTAA